MNSDVLKAGATSVSSITYGYDPDNNVTSKKTTGVAGAGDQLGRLTTWTKGTTATQYGWDNASNRTKAGTKLATYDERNRLLNDGTSTYTYSPRGANERGLKSLRDKFEKEVKPQFWKDEAANNPGGHSSADLARMKSGKAPIGNDGYPMELYHKVMLSRGGSNSLDNLIPLTRTECRLGGNYLKNHRRLPK